MGKKINLLCDLPSIKRPLDQRKQASEQDRAYHWQLGKEYFDGTRMQGYGGYIYDGRWRPVARRLHEHYALPSNAKILDIGCAKGFLLHDFKLEFPDVNVFGLDISSYALSKCPQSITGRVVLGNAKSLPFPSDYFDLVVSINSLHNILSEDEVKQALIEIERVSKGNSFVGLSSWSTAEEKEKIDNWAVVGTTYLQDIEWIKLFKSCNYQGDYWWFKP